MAILGMVFKIIGIILVCIVGFLLLLLFGILMVPIRYRGMVRDRDEVQLEAEISWLCHIVGVQAKRQNEETKMTFRFLGFSKQLWNAEHDDPDTTGFREMETEEDTEDFFVTRDIKEAPNPRENSELSGKDACAALEKGEKSKERVPSSEKKADEQRLVEKEPEQEGRSTDKKAKQERKRERAPEREEKKTEAKPETDRFESKKPKGKKRQALQKKWKKKTSSFCDRREILKQKIAKGRQVIADEENKEAVRLLWREIRYLLHHYGPRTMKGEVCFGTGNPAWTGELLAGISLFPIVYQKGFSVQPNFESEKAYVYGEVRIKGHLRAVHLIKSAICLLRSKVVRRTIKQVRG